MGIRDEGLPMPAAVVGLSPWVDLALTGRSLLRLAGADPMLDLRDLANFAQNYLGGHLPTDPHASPLYGDYHGLPSILLHVGSNEVLKDDALRAAKLAEDAGADVSIEVWDGQYHVFQALPVKAADASIARMGSFIRSRTVLSAVARPHKSAAQSADRANVAE
jgi:acetyl esterase/lipase